VRTPLNRRLQDLEAKNDTTDDDMPVDWGPGFERMPPMTKGGLRRMLKAMHESGAGRLPIVKRDVVMCRQA
jgi:hypothetical protein